MPHTVSSIWNDLPGDLIPRLETCLNAKHLPDVQTENKMVYFRADDIAVPSENFSRLMALFSRYNMPLCLSVVPAWLTRNRWSCLKSTAGHDHVLWCWHQHGWRHVNHSTQGKKYEFGPQRSVSQINQDLKHGKTRLEKIMGENFYPVFTPPWNRCDDNTLELLKKLKYMAVSRSYPQKPHGKVRITEYNVNVDLHTRKEKDPGTGWNNLFQEFSRAFASGICGIMIHHQRMNKPAFVFLEYLFQVLADKKHIRIVHFKDMDNGQSIKYR